MALGVYVRLRVPAGGCRAPERLRECAPGSDAAMLGAEPRLPARLTGLSSARGCRARCGGSERRSGRGAIAVPSRRAAAAAVPEAERAVAVRGSPRVRRKAGRCRGWALPGSGSALGAVRERLGRSHGQESRSSGARWVRWLRRGSGTALAAAWRMEQRDSAPLLTRSLCLVYSPTADCGIW